jgi:predicted dehydrogenase
LTFPINRHRVWQLVADEHVRLVSIASPPATHHPIALEALAAGKAVLCDKPFGLDATEAASLDDEAEAAEVVHLVNFEFRHHPVRRQVRDLVVDGAVGRVEHVQWTHLSAASRVPMRPHGWLFERRRGGGWIGAWGSHAIDALRWIVGEVHIASAHCRTSITHRPDSDGRLRPVDAEDGFSAWLELACGATVWIDSDFAAVAPVAPRLVFQGSEGVLECVADARLTLRRVDGTRAEIEPAAVSGDPHLVPMHRWAEVVRDAVREGQPVAPTFADGVACRLVLDAMVAG